MLGDPVTASEGRRLAGMAMRLGETEMVRDWLLWALDLLGLSGTSTSGHKAVGVHGLETGWDVPRTGWDGS